MWGNLLYRLKQKNTLLAITPGLCTFLLQFGPDFGGPWSPENITSLVMFFQVLWFSLRDGNTIEK